MESSVKFVRGSHRWGQWFHPRKFASEANYPLEAGAGAGRAESGDKVFADVPVAEIESGQHEVSRAGRGGALWAGRGGHLDTLDTGHCAAAGLGRRARGLRGVPRQDAARRRGQLLHLHAEARALHQVGAGRASYSRATKIHL